MSEITPMPTDIPMPSASIWDQYAVAAILFVVVCVIGLAGWRAFREFRGWQTSEYERQRLWYETMEKKRDESQSKRDLLWQQFYQLIQDHQAKRDRENNEIMSKMISRIDSLTETITMHDRKSAQQLETLADQVRQKRRVP